MGEWLAGLNWWLSCQVLPAGQLAPKVVVSRLNLVQMHQRAVWAECSLRRAQGASDWPGAAGGSWLMWEEVVAVRLGSGGCLLRSGASILSFFHQKYVADLATRWCAVRLPAPPRLC
eukprot:SAG31_NODE_2002_length_6689_cov_120.013202_7_plen_117_part_00